MAEGSRLMNGRRKPSADGYEIGYGVAPKASRFEKGRSGNPRGRPKGKRQLPYESVLGQWVTIREVGNERRVTAEQAFLLKLAQNGLTGDSSAALTSLRALEAAHARRGDAEEETLTSIVVHFVAVENVNEQLRPLRMAVKLDPFRQTARMGVEPWLVEAALARLGRRLSPTEQAIVRKATRTPRKVNWPDWWEVRE